MRLLLKRLPLLLTLVPAVLWPQRDYVDSLFVEGNRYYEQGQYSVAVNLYNRILDQGFDHSHLYYNLGNAYYQLGLLGEAVWAYEKGLRLNPRDGDLAFNLRVAKAHTVDRVEAPEPIILLKWYRSLKSRFSPSQWLRIVGAIFFVTALLYSLSRLLLTQYVRPMRMVVSLGLMATFGSGLIFGDSYLEASGEEEAIVVVKEGKVYSAPTEMSNLLFVVHSGTKTVIKSSRDPWLEIELIDGKRGWIRWENVKLL